MTALRDRLLVGLNGELLEVRGADAFSSLSTWLRERRRLTGTKIVCSEGDCGACTVLVGRPSGDAGGFRYRAVDSCIAFLYQFDRCHVITVDGLERGGVPHPAQMAMAENFGSQCGFCTPGFVMSLADLTEQARAASKPCLDDPTARIGLTGNLCRCTGYLQILQSAAAIDPDGAEPLSELYDERPLREAFGASGDTTVRIEDAGRRVVVPSTWTEALEARAEMPRAVVVAGATDLGVRHNKALHAGRETTRSWLHLRTELQQSRVEVLPKSPSEEDPVPTARRLRLTAGATWTEVLEAARGPAPELARILEVFGGPQIRNLGTVGGNLVNASPIADSLPFLYVCEAQVRLESVRGTRTVPIAELYRGYKELDLAPDELLASVEVRLPDTTVPEHVRLIKVSRRRDLDISSFTAAVWLTLDGAVIREARVAMGGVAPTVVRLPRCEERLIGGSLDRETFLRAGESAAEEIRPISDVRGRDTYRRLLARNALLRVLHDLRGDPIDDRAVRALEAVST